MISTALCRHATMMAVLTTAALTSVSCRPGVGSTRTSTIDDMVMVYVPAGPFQMGSGEAGADVMDNEKPSHEVYLDGYWMDRTEVTNAMFERFVAAQGYVTVAEQQGWGAVFAGEGSRQVAGANWRNPGGPGSDLAGRESHPVVQVTWQDATAYCAWAGRRLPTEAEWEKAARGVDGRSHPWGDDAPTVAHCNFNTGAGETRPVGHHSPIGDSPYGAADMAGNVREWCGDWFSGNYYVVSPRDHPLGPDTGTERVLRGGSWKRVARFVRSALRDHYEPEYRCDGVGFRCVLPMTHPTFSN